MLLDNGAQILLWVSRTGGNQIAQMFGTWEVEKINWSEVRIVEEYFFDFYRFDIGLKLFYYFYFFIYYFITIFFFFLFLSLAHG